MNREDLRRVTLLKTQKEAAYRKAESEMIQAREEYQKVWKELRQHYLSPPQEQAGDFTHGWLDEWHRLPR